MSDRPLSLAFALAGLVLLGLGLTEDAWWTIAGGVAALAAAAWLLTEPPAGSGDA